MNLPAEVTWVWSDGPATGGFQEGGGGALIAFPGGDIREVQVAAGFLCSSTRAEFFALRPALKELSGGEDRAASQPIVVGTESLAVMALLQSDPCARRTPVAADIWSLLRPPAHSPTEDSRSSCSGSSLTAAARHRASGRPRAVGQRPPSTRNSGRRQDHPVGRRVLRRLLATAGRTAGFVRCGGTDARSRSKRLIGVSGWTAISYGRTTGANRRSASGSAVYLRLTARSTAPMSIPPHYASIIEKRLAFLNKCCSGAPGAGGTPPPTPGQHHSLRFITVLTSKTPCLAMNERGRKR